jgi:hypothetical protein
MTVAPPRGGTASHTPTQPRRCQLRYGDAQTARTGVLANHCSSQAAALHSYQMYIYPPSATRSASIMVEPHLGHVRAQPACGGRNPIFSGYVVSIVLLSLPACLAFPYASSHEGRGTNVEDRSYRTIRNYYMSAARETPEGFSSYRRPGRPLRLKILCIRRLRQWASG